MNPSSFVDPFLKPPQPQHRDIPPKKIHSQSEQDLGTQFFNALRAEDEIIPKTAASSDKKV